MRQDGPNGPKVGHRCRDRKQRPQDGRRDDAEVHLRKLGRDQEEQVRDAKS